MVLLLGLAVLLPSPLSPGLHLFWCRGLLSLAPSSYWAQAQAPNGYTNWGWLTWFPSPPSCSASLLVFSWGHAVVGSIHLLPLCLAYSGMPSGAAITGAISYIVHRLQRFGRRGLLSWSPRSCLACSGGKADYLRLPRSSKNFLVPHTRISSHLLSLATTTASELVDHKGLFRHYRLES